MANDFFCPRCGNAHDASIYCAPRSDPCHERSDSPTDGRTIHHIETIKEQVSEIIKEYEAMDKAEDRKRRRDELACKVFLVFAKDLESREIAGETTQDFWGRMAKYSCIAADALMEELGK